MKLIAWWKKLESRKREAGIPLSGGRHLNVPMRSALFVAQDKNTPQTDLRDLLAYITEQCRSRVRFGWVQGIKGRHQHLGSLSLFFCFPLPASSSGRLFSCRQMFSSCSRLRSCQRSASSQGLQGRLSLDSDDWHAQCWANHSLQPGYRFCWLARHGPVPTPEVGEAGWASLTLYDLRGTGGEFTKGKSAAIIRRERMEGKAHRGLLRFSCISSEQNVLPRLPPSAASHGNWLETQVHRPRPRPTEWKEPSPRPLGCLVNFQDHSSKPVDLAPDFN